MPRQLVDIPSAPHQHPKALGWVASIRRAPEFLGIEVLVKYQECGHGSALQ